ncbi:aldo/keto reductase [Rathayibacter sp. VKM Ac-2760]|uniref:aldo/keto reductase n=1 Tax=Rathayibacter sp. VKM Ac-2760 TaxID=2609253 RepID=UPI001318715A|nr:aldo/keto reductase [Rathayibacter sp. VKM Ac-2760]QHC58261.1 aldo/keto reductase [Rathayibacter sp. VKM Ac-2760]
MARLKTGSAVRTIRGTAPIPPLEDTRPVVAPAALKRRLGDTAQSLFPLVFDAAALGRRGAGGRASDGPDLLERFAARGGDAVVVTDGTGSAEGEERVGGWLAGDRDRFLLLGRVGASAEAVATPRALVARVEESLRRLRTDRLDVLAVRPDGAGRLDEVLSAVEVLLARGLVRTAVASGFAAEELFEARVLAGHGHPRFAAVELPYSLLDAADAEGDLGLVAAGQGLSLLSTVPLAHGFLHGVERGRRQLSRLPDGALAAAHLGRRGRRVLTALDAIGAELTAAPAAVALAWLLARPGVAAAVVAPRSPSDVDALVRAVSLELDEGHLAALERARR